MCMKRENKNKIAVIGHTKGIGKAIADLYSKMGFKVIGMSRANGYDLVENQEAIMESIRSGKFVYDISGAAR